MNKTTNQKEFLIVSFINTIASIMLALALMAHFVNEKPKEFVIFLVVLSIVIDVSTRFFAKRDHRAKMTAKFSGVIGALFLIFILFFAY